MVRCQIKEALVHSNCFHAEWYLSQYKHLLDEGVEPLDDYIDVGFKAGRNPNFIFDNKHYLNQVSGLAAAEGNPLFHYCVEGWGQFFDPGPEFNSWWYCVQHMGGRLDQNPLAHFLEKGNSQGLSTTLAAGQVLCVSDKAAFNSRSISLFQSLSMTAELASRVADSVARLGQYDLADMFVAKACELEPDNPDWFVQLARILAHRNGWNRMFQAMCRALELEAGRADWWFLAAQAAERLGKHDAAASYYGKAIELGLTETQCYYRLGRCQLALGNLSASTHSFQLALACADHSVQSLGVGALHEADGAWPLAAQAYAQRAMQLQSAELHYRHGCMLDLEYRWEEAVDALRSAIAVDASPAEYHYRLGCVLERLEEFDSAARSYQEAITRCNEDQPDWHYRLGNVLFQMGAYERACEAWLQALPEEGPLTATSLSIEDLQARISKDRQNPDEHVLLGALLESTGQWEAASISYLEAASRRSDYSARDYFCLGRSLAALGRHEEACEAFREIRLFKRQYSPGSVEKPSDIKQQYVECLETLDIRKGVILYESFHGASVSCNPFALFRYLLNNPDYQNLLHVWAVRSELSIPAEYRAIPNVVFVRHGSHGYIRYLATAQYLVNNNTFLPYFMRREGQSYLNTWHGTPLKKLGCDIPNSTFDHKNVLRNFLHVTHFLYPNEHTLSTLLSAHQAADLYVGACLGSGQPRMDLMLAADEGRCRELRERVGIDNDLPILLYAPTWRGTLASPEVGMDDLEAAIRELSDYPVNVVFSGHHIIKSRVNLEGLGVHVLDAGIDITEFLSVVDVLVTDYSSVLFDYLPLRRPIILYAHDLDEYKAQRGLYFDLNELPVFVCKNSEELHDNVSFVLEGRRVPDSALDAAIQKFCPWEDGSASARAVKFFLSNIGGNSLPADARRRWLFYTGPFAPNGITSSFVQLVSRLSPEDNSVYVGIDPWLLESYPQRMQRFSLVSDKIKTLGRISFPVASAEETWLDGQFNAAKGRVSRHAERLLMGMYKREFRRLYGEARFDAVIDFCGYNRFWSKLFAWGRPGTKGMQWLHNDMLAEKDSRFPGLEISFQLFNKFDRLISVSEEVKRVNLKNLSARYCIPEERFLSVPNLIDPQWLKAQAEAPLEASLSSWMNGAELLIGTVARLSPEKGLDRLIDAFSSFAIAQPRARLLIAGQGPLRDELKRQITRLGLDQHVKLVGFMENPYPFMRRLDLFVLPSRYEGQGIVLLEALVLGCAVIATDIPGAREVLAGTRGLLVDSSAEGLLEGLNTFAKHGLAYQEFDAENYVRSAMNAFHAALTF